MADDMFKEDPEEEFEEEFDPTSEQEKLDNDNRQRPVIISKDCREVKDRGSAGDLSLYQGILLGMYNFSENFKDLSELKKITNVYELEDEELFANPLIYIPKAMEYIWGIQCWWCDLENISEKLQGSLDNIEKLVSKGKTPEDINWDEFLKQQ